jgi:hypothetical protein
MVLVKQKYCSRWITYFIRKGVWEIQDSVFEIYDDLALNSTLEQIKNKRMKDGFWYKVRNPKRWKEFKNPLKGCSLFPSRRKSEKYHEVVKDTITSVQVPEGIKIKDEKEFKVLKCVINPVDSYVSRKISAVIPYPESQFNAHDNTGDNLVKAIKYRQGRAFYPKDDKILEEFENFVEDVFLPQFEPVEKLATFDEWLQDHPAWTKAKKQSLQKAHKHNEDYGFEYDDLKRRMLSLKMKLSTNQVTTFLG